MTINERPTTRGLIASKHAKNQLNSNSFLMIQQILESHELNDHIHFGQTHPKSIEITFSLPKFAPAFKKTVHSINSFLR